MAFMKIHCNYCNQSWEIYGSRDWTDDKNRECPHCQQEIDRDTWRREILPAFGAFSDANRELFKDHAGDHRTLFTVDFVADHIFPIVEKEDRRCPLLEDLDGLADISDIPGVCDLIDKDGIGG